MAKQNLKIKAFLAQITPEYALAALVEHCKDGRTCSPANCKWIAHSVVKDLDPNDNRFDHDSGYSYDEMDRSLRAKLRRVLVKLAEDDSSPVELRGWGKRQTLRVVSAEEQAERAAADADRKERVDFVTKAAADLGLDLDGYRGHANGGNVTLSFEQFKTLATTAMVHKRLHG